MNNVYGTVGFPLDQSDQWNSTHVRRLGALIDGREADLPKAKRVAVGEMGLDLRGAGDPTSAVARTLLDRQVEILREQAALAQRKGLPIILGCRSSPDRQAALLTLMTEVLKGVSANCCFPLAMP